MRPEKNPLDLNNFPEDFSKDGKQVYEDGSSSVGGGGGGGHRKKKSGGKDGKDECGKVYECRFCSLKFCKSQALGGHMNRHRQERETEQLNNARQLVYSNDNNLAVQGRHLGCHPIGSGGYHPAAAAGSIGDPFRSAAYPPRLFSGAATSPTLLQPPPPPPQPPYLYTSPSRHPSPYPPQYPPPPPSHQQPPINDYYIGHVLNNPNPSQQPYPPTHINFGNSESNNNNYTCIGAPVGFGPAGSGRGMSDQGSGRDGSSTSLSNQDQEGLNWGRSCSSHPASINRFQDGF